MPSQYANIDLGYCLHNTAIIFEKVFLSPTAVGFSLEFKLIQYNILYYITMYLDTNKIYHYQYKYDSRTYTVYSGQHDSGIDVVMQDMSREDATRLVYVLNGWREDANIWELQEKYGQPICDSTYRTDRRWLGHRLIVQGCPKGCYYYQPIGTWVLTTLYNIHVGESVGQMHEIFRYVFTDGKNAISVKTGERHLDAQICADKVEWYNGRKK
jgi:hypothetical protein